MVFNVELLAAAGAADPPVCRLLNHSQVSYEAKVKERKAEKKQHENRKLATIKEVSFLLLCCSFHALSLLFLASFALSGRLVLARSIRDQPGVLIFFASPVASLMTLHHEYVRDYQQGAHRPHERCKTDKFCKPFTC